jgi:hypothetical protein
MKYKCKACGKTIQQDDKFCQNCGAPQKGTTSANTAKRKAMPKNLSTAPIVKCLALAIATGLVFGWIRYWIGYYILIQGVIAGVTISWMVKQTAGEYIEALANIRFKMVVLLFFMFMIGQAFGFGLAQPVFDPFNWLARVWNADTTESVFGIFSTAGVVSRTFSEGLNGGFWVILSLIDLFFMLFLMLVTMPLPTKKN